MKLPERIDLRLSTETYATLRAEVDGDTRRVPDLIRQKLAASILGNDDIQLLKAQQRLIIELVKHLLIDEAPVLTRILGMVDSYTEEKKREERVRLERIMTERYELIERLTRSVGL